MTAGMVHAGAAAYVAGQCRGERPRRTVVVGAHPDDEVIGAGASLTHLDGVVVVTVTDGAPRDGGDAAAHGFASVEAYAAARRRELHAAMALAGIPARRCASLGCADQEAAWRMAEVAEELVEQFALRDAEVVVTQPYEGGHPDHDATAFAVAAACAVMRGQGLRVPVVVEMTGYHAGAEGLEAGVFLAANTGERPAEVVAGMGEEARALKARMLGCFASQAETLRYFPMVPERFRAAPRYDFSRRPHAGRLFYEHFSWGCTGEEFCRNAVAAARRLGVEVSPCR